jgi:hypothetical protein
MHPEDVDPPCRIDARSGVEGRILLRSNYSFLQRSVCFLLSIGAASSTGTRTQVRARSTEMSKTGVLGVLSSQMPAPETPRWVREPPLPDRRHGGHNARLPNQARAALTRRARGCQPRAGRRRQLRPVALRQPLLERLLDTRSHVGEPALRRQ